VIGNEHASIMQVDVARGTHSGTAVVCTAGWEVLGGQVGGRCLVGSTCHLVLLLASKLTRTMHETAPSTAAGHAHTPSARMQPHDDDSRSIRVE
jgi:hypothetical protein